MLEGAQLPKFAKDGWFAHTVGSRQALDVAMCIFDCGCLSMLALAPS